MIFSHPDHISVPLTGSRNKTQIQDLLESAMQTFAVMGLTSENALHQTFFGYRICLGVVSMQHEPPPELPIIV